MKWYGILALVFLVFVLAVVVYVDISQESNFDLSSSKLIDLTHTFSNNTIYWPTEKEGFVLETTFEGMTDKGFYYSQKMFAAPEHGGTHMDAPIHFHKDGITVEQIPIEQLVAKAILVDITDKTKDNSDYELTIQDITEWESQHGIIPQDSIILVKTGWAKYWPDRETYLGTSQLGSEAIPLLHFPGVSPQASKWLTENREISAVGIDTASIDYGQSTLFETHQILATKNIPIFENVAITNDLPAKDFHIIALPVKIDGGSGAPLRIVAIVS